MLPSRYAARLLFVLCSDYDQGSDRGPTTRTNSALPEGYKEVQGMHRSSLDGVSSVSLVRLASIHDDGQILLAVGRFWHEIKVPVLV